MNEPREPRASDTIAIPPGNSQAATAAVDSAAPASGVGCSPGAPTLELDPGQSGAVDHLERVRGHAVSQMELCRAMAVAHAAGIISTET